MDLPTLRSTDATWGLDLCICPTTSKMFERQSVVVHDIKVLKSVLDIEGVAKSLVERGPLNDAKLGHHRGQIPRTRPGFRRVLRSLPLRHTPDSHRLPHVIEER